MELASVSTVNLNRVFCPTAPVCLPVVGGEPVQRGDHHVTALGPRHAVYRALVKADVLDRAS